MTSITENKNIIESAINNDGKTKKGWIFGKFKAALNILITVLCAVCFRSFIYEPFNVPSGSMKSTLLEGDYIFVAKYAYGYSRYSLPFHLPLIDGKIFKRHPARGDIVVFVPENMGRTYFIKRIIGLPGDTIQLRDGTLYINDMPMARQFLDIYHDSGPYGNSQLKRYIETFENGRNHYVLQELKGSYMNNTPRYIVPEGKYFMMGDNRDNSRDSRFITEIGYIPEENIIGRAGMVAFSISPYNKWYKMLRTDRLFTALGTNINLQKPTQNETAPE